MIRVACPHCGRTYRTMTEGMGKTAVCTKCRQSFRIGQARPKFTWRQTDLGEDSWIGVVPPEEKQELKHCIICDAPLAEGSVRCPACGANQVTGVVHRRRTQASPGKVPIWSMIPVRLILVVVALVLVGAGVYRAVRAISESAATTSEQLVHQTILKRAVAHLRQGGDEHSFPREFSGEVTDDNLPSFVKMLSAGEADTRRAAALLIACGNVTQLRPILDRARDDANGSGVDQALEAIGSRRLVELSGHEDRQVRQAAAEALCRLSRLEPDEETISRLADATPVADKIRRLNTLCRPWPQAVGTFVVVIAEAKSPFTVTIEQIGRTFYMQVRSTEFRSFPTERRTFHIPIEQWCAATGSAVDVGAVRRLMSGSITLASPLGASWRGTVTLTMRGEVPALLPGFLPFEPPRRGDTIQERIGLE